MFDSRSRYANIESDEYISPDGKRILYKRRRFLPKGDELSLLVEVTVAEGDRLDLIQIAFWEIQSISGSSVMPTMP